MSKSATFLLAFIVIYTSITTVPVYTINPFTVGISLIGPFVERLKESIGPLKYTFYSADSNGFTMIAEKKRYYLCLWLCKDPNSILEETCASIPCGGDVWSCPRKNLTQIEKWTIIKFSAENKCKQITSYLYAAYRYSKGIEYKNFAEDIEYFLRQHNHLYECHVQSTLSSIENIPIPCVSSRHNICRSKSKGHPLATTTLKLHLF